jgi:hypothetical protein
LSLGQQIQSDGALVLTDALLTSNHLSRLLADRSTVCVQDLHLILPFVSSQWATLFREQLNVDLQHAQVDDVSNRNGSVEHFGDRFYETLIACQTCESVDFDIYNKLIAKDSSGTSET